MQALLWYLDSLLTFAHCDILSEIEMKTHEISRFGRSILLLTQYTRGNWNSYDSFDPAGSVILPKFHRSSPAWQCKVLPIHIFVQFAHMFCCFSVMLRCFCFTDAFIFMGYCQMWALVTDTNSKNIMLCLSWRKHWSSNSRKSLTLAFVGKDRFCKTTASVAFFDT